MSVPRQVERLSAALSVLTAHGMNIETAGLQVIYFWGWRAHWPGCEYTTQPPPPICTSHVERNNGTIRTFMKRFCRLTYAFSKKLANHEAAIAMFIAYYSFCWRTRHTDQSGKPGKLRPTAAMMAKVVPDLCSFERLYNEVIQYG